jgi:hypothetical protein
MSELIPYPKVNDANNSSSPTEQLAKGAKGAICGAYHTYKDWYHQNIGIDTLQGALLNTFWSAACPNEPIYSPPPPSSPPFSGGQCRDVQYLVKYSYNVNSGTIGVDRLSSDQKIVWGAIVGTFNDLTGFTANANYQVRYHLLSTSTAYNGSDSNPAKINVAGVQFNVTKPYIRIDSVSRIDGQPDNCGSLPAPPPPPILAPPPIIDNNITINHNGNNINVAGSFNPKFLSPTLNLNFKIPLGFNLNLNPQFNGNPTLNLNFGNGGVSVDSGEGDNINNLGDNINNISNNINNLGNNINNVSNNISNLTNNTNNNTNTINNIKNTNDDNNKFIREIKDKLACNPCDLLDEIKKKLDYTPVFNSASINNFQSVTRDNLFNIGYLEIELIQLPRTTKIVEGGNGDDTMYTGWILWRRSGFNFEKLQITTAKSTYWSPKWADGFSIVCTNNARANCYYYIEQKD